VLDELIAQEAVLQEGDPYPILKLTTTGSDILFGREVISALRKEEPKTKPKTFRDSKDEPGTFDESLFASLRSLRKKMADAQHVPPYIIFSDKTLHDMCRRLPTSLAGLRMISGVGDAKLQRYGNDFILEIKRHLDGATT